MLQKRMPAWGVTMNVLRLFLAMSLCLSWAPWVYGMERAGTGSPGVEASISPESSSGSVVNISRVCQKAFKFLKDSVVGRGLKMRGFQNNARPATLEFAAYAGRRGGQSVFDVSFARLLMACSKPDLRSTIELIAAAKKRVTQTRVAVISYDLYMQFSREFRVASPKSLAGEDPLLSLFFEYGWKVAVVGWPFEEQAPVLIEQVGGPSASPKISRQKIDKKASQEDQIAFFIMSLLA